MMDYVRPGTTGLKVSRICLGTMTYGSKKWRDWVLDEQEALAWMLSKPFVTAPIVGASKPVHLEQSVEALALRLNPEQIAGLGEPYQPHRIEGH